MSNQSLFNYLKNLHRGNGRAGNLIANMSRGAAKKYIYMSRLCFDSVKLSSKVK